MIIIQLQLMLQLLYNQSRPLASRRLINEGLIPPKDGLYNQSRPLASRRYY